MWQDFNSHILHGNHVWARSTGTTSASVAGQNSNQLFIIVWNNDAATKGTTNEEDTESPVDSFEGRLERFARVGRFSSHHSNIFGSNNGEGCLPKRCEKALKSTQVASGYVFCKCSLRILESYHNLGRGKPTGSFQYLKPYASCWGFPPTIVINVNMNTIPIKMTLPLDSQNSLSPYHLTANKLIILSRVSNFHLTTKIRDLRIKYNTSCTHSSNWNIVPPEGQD